LAPGPIFPTAVAAAARTLQCGSPSASERAGRASLPPGLRNPRAAAACARRPTFGSLSDWTRTETLRVTSVIAHRDADLPAGNRPGLCSQAFPYHEGA